MWLSTVLELQTANNAHRPLTAPSRYVLHVERIKFLTQLEIPVWLLIAQIFRGALNAKQIKTVMLLFVRHVTTEWIRSTMGLNARLISNAQSAIVKHASLMKTVQQDARLVFLDSQ